MARGFTESEAAAIRAKLIESCRYCWQRYGFQKTTVGELARMAGISTGAFYGFFPSKALLFAETAMSSFNQIADNFTAAMPEHPMKADLGNALKGMIRDFAANPWLISQEGGLAMMRQLPPDKVAELVALDMGFVREVLERYHFDSTVSVEEFTAVIYALCLPVTMRDVIGEHFLTAMDILVDGAVDRLIR
ncbi:MAG TPA: TetR/AcrR family transcriptional regulator [Pseudonocardiaceae bacterium]